MHALHTTVLAAVAGTTADTNTFWNSSIGGAIKALLVGVGIIVVILAALKAIKDVTGGKPGAAAKTVIAAGVLAAVLFNPNLISDLITLLGDLVSKLIDSVNSITGGSSGGTGGAATPTP